MLPMSILSFLLKNKKQDIGENVLYCTTYIHSVDYMLHFFGNYTLMPRTLKTYRMLLMKENEGFVGFSCGGLENAQVSRKRVWNI